MHDLEKLIQRNKENLLEIIPSYQPNTAPDQKSSQKIWNEYKKNCLPDSFMIMHNLVTREIIHTHNVSNMGYDVNHVNDIIQSTHESHTPFLTHNIVCLLLVIYKYHNGDAKFMNMYSTSLRSLKDNKNNFQYLKLTSLPVSQDSNNNPMEYITWYTPIESYDGQPYQVRLIPIRNDLKSEAIISTYKNLINESFDYLKFTKRQKEVILLINAGLKKCEIAEKLQISTRTVEKYNEQILDKGKLLFVVNSFRTSQDVVWHLSKMNILPER